MPPENQPQIKNSYTTPVLSDDFKKSSKKHTRLIILAIIMILVGIVSVWFLLNLKQERQNNLFLGTDVVFGSWKTYKNDRVEYEFELPSSGLSFDLEETIKYPSNLESRFSDLVQFGVNGIIYSITVIADTPHNSIVSWIQDKNESNIDGDLNLYTKITVGDKEAYISKNELATYVMADGNIYMIIAYKRGSPSTNINDTIYNRIISTFKFVD